MNETNEGHSSSSCSAVCTCGSTRIERKDNVGFDIWEGGEENQHEDRCLECGATRIVHDWIVYPDRSGTSYGKWHIFNRN
jgi:hypothetical protein